MSETLNGNTDTSTTNGFTNLAAGKYDSNRAAELASWNAFALTWRASALPFKQE
jgi:hypothetical protein